MNHQVAIVLGTRPELIKLAPIIHLLGPDTVVIHTGQHDHEHMSARIAATVGIPLQYLTTRHNRADAGRGAQLGDMIAALDRRWRADPPVVVVVQGDTTSALAGALAANHADLPLVHVEAGLRSFDRSMPEEHNRVVIDPLADLCCAPTELNRANLRAEAIPDNRILLTGNTIIEAVQALLPGPTTRTHLLDQHNLTAHRYMLATLHRPENVDHPEILDLGALTRQWLNHTNRHHNDLADQPSPFGDGTATHQITDALNQLTQPNPDSEIRHPVGRSGTVISTV